MSPLSTTRTNQQSRNGDEILTTKYFFSFQDGEDYDTNVNEESENDRIEDSPPDTDPLQVLTLMLHHFG